MSFGSGSESEKVAGPVELTRVVEDWRPGDGRAGTGGRLVGNDIDGELGLEDDPKSRRGILSALKCKSVCCVEWSQQLRLVCRRGGISR